MNKNSILTFGCAMAVTLAPHSVNAATVKDGLNACASAMVSELAVSNGAPLDYSMSEDGNASGARLKARQTIHLDAMNPQSKKVVARADCVVDSRARVKKLVHVSLDEPDAARRAVSL